MLGSDYYTGGFIDKRAGSVQPLSYCRGLAHAALARGVNIFGDSPVKKIDISGHRKRIVSSNGSVTADKVLVCTNGYTNLVPNDPLILNLSRSVIPFYSYIIATRPLSEKIRESILPGEQVVGWRLYSYKKE